MTACPGPLKIISSAGTVDVQKFTAGKETGMQAALQRLRIEAIGQKTAGRHLRSVEPIGASHRQTEVRADPCCLSESIFRERSDRGRGGKPGSFHNHPAQTVMEHACKELRALQLRKLFLALSEQVKNGDFIKRQQLQMQGLAVASERDSPGELKPGGTGDSGFSKLNLAMGLRQKKSFAGQAQRSLDPDTLQRARIFGIGENTCERGIESRTPVAQRFTEAISVGDTAELRAGCTAAGEDQGIGTEPGSTGADRESGLFEENFLYREGAVLLNPGAVQDGRYALLYVENGTYRYELNQF